MNTKTPHFKLYLKLKQQECTIDKSIEAFLVSCKVDTEVCHNIKRTIDQFDRDRKETVESLNTTVASIYQELKAAKATINEQKVEKIDVEELKKKLHSLWSRIEEFKNSCNCIDSLKAEQNSLESDLNALQRSIRKHKNFSSAGSLHCKIDLINQTPKDESAKECDYDDVEDFCALLAKTGHTGNWSEEDHLLFVRARRKHKGIAALVGAIQAKCPDLTKESIVNHEAWYKKYLSLREKQREAVREWRQRREAERLSRRRRESADAPAAKPPSPLVFKKQIKDEEEEQAEERRREALRRWREERDKARAAEEERAKSAERAKLESAESRRRARDAEVKRILAERREKNQSRLTREIEQCVKPSGNSFILQYYRARDQEYLEKRKSILMSKYNVQSKQFTQPMQCNIYKNNESTLFKETKAWQDKIRNDEIKSFNTVSYIKDLPKRTIATWRSFEITS